MGRRQSVMTVETFARQEAGNFSQFSGKDRREAYRELKMTLQALLDSMGAGEVDELPVPTPNGDGPKILVLTKVGKSEFATRAK